MIIIDLENNATSIDFAKPCRRYCSSVYADNMIL